MSFLPRFQLSVAPPTQGIAGPHAPPPSQLCLDLGIERKDGGIPGPCNSHQSVGVAGLSNPGSSESARACTSRAQHSHGAPRPRSRICTGAPFPSPSRACTSRAQYSHGAPWPRSWVCTPRVPFPSPSHACTSRARHSHSPAERARVWECVRMAPFQPSNPQVLRLQIVSLFCCNIVHCRILIAKYKGCKHT